MTGIVSAIKLYFNTTSFIYYTPNDSIYNQVVHWSHQTSWGLFVCLFLYTSLEKEYLDTLYLDSVLRTLIHTMYILLSDVKLDLLSKFWQSYLDMAKMSAYIVTVHCISDYYASFSDWKLRSSWGQKIGKFWLFWCEEIVVQIWFDDYYPIVKSMSNI